MAGVPPQAERAASKWQWGQPEQPDRVRAQRTSHWLGGRQDHGQFRNIQSGGAVGCWVSDWDGGSNMRL